MVAEPIVLIPPMMTDARVYGPQIGALSPDYAVMYAPTTQGERMEEIASQILSWAPSKFALVGMSMGGAIALEIMRRAGNRVTRLALISTSPLADSPQKASEREPLIVAARSGRFADVIGKEMNTEWLANGPDRVEIGNLIADMAFFQGPDAYVRQARAMQRRKDQQTTLRKISQPTLVMCGDEDRLLPIQRHEFLAGMIPDAKLSVIVGAGHLPTLEQPDAVTQGIREWMSQPMVLR